MKDIQLNSIFHHLDRMQARLLGGIGHLAYFFCIPHNDLNIFSF